MLDSKATHATYGALMPPADMALKKVAMERWHRFMDTWKASMPSMAFPDELVQEAMWVFTYSHFVFRSLIQDPDILPGLIENGGLLSPSDPEKLKRTAGKWTRDTLNPTELARALRRLRRRQMVRIAWRDICGRAKLEETMEDLSGLAEICLDTALKRLHSWQIHKMGRPIGISGQEQSLVVLGMGKLGARELNFSSDIDLIFALPETGWTIGGPRKVTNQEFFTRLAQELIKVISKTTADGFVFRIDMRLRPYGDSGPLVLPFDAMEEYYESQGRPWERYAMVKARPVAGDKEAGNRLLARLSPFIYRRYLDYGIFDSLRVMKRQIETEAVKRGMEHNIKLGPGGIREIEFIGQTFQLVQGGRLPELRERRTLKILDILGKKGIIDGDACKELKDAYVFLRTTEHRLQEYDDQQIHDIPKQEHLLDRLAASMGFLPGDRFLKTLKGHMDRVSRHFSSLFGRDSQEVDQSGTRAWLLWNEPQDMESSVAAARSLGFHSPEETARRINIFKHCRKTLSLSTSAREKLDRLMPLVITGAASSTDPDTALHRMLNLLEAVEGRTCYLALMLENPRIIKHLTRLIVQGSWIADILSRHPILLDELLDTQTLYSSPGKADMNEELSAILAGIPQDDLERQMDELRRFRQASMLRIASADISGTLTVDQVGYRLSALAEIVLERVLAISSGHLAARSGHTDRPTYPDFLIVGYGKLGGMEMGYSSDLDLVFLYRAGHDKKRQGQEDKTFYTRLGQRIIHMLTARTPAGRLYEIDMRLRPSGEQGVLVTSLESFHEYQMRRAWTWEHQALTRARPVAGHTILARAFKSMKEGILARPRDAQGLKASIGRMRNRIIGDLQARAGKAFDLKRGEGGLMDIEFMVQFLVLAHCHRYPILAHVTHCGASIKLIKQLGLLTPQQAHWMYQAYCEYRKTINRMSLAGKPALVSPERFLVLRERIRTLWKQIIG